MVVLTLVLSPALGVGVGNSSTAQALRASLATFASVPLETVVIAGVYEVGSGALTRYNTHAEVNYAGNSPVAAPQYEATLEALGVPSFSNSPLPLTLLARRRRVQSTPTTTTTDDAPLSMASHTTSMGYASTFPQASVVVTFNILGLVLGTTSESSVVAIKERIASAWGANPSTSPLGSLAYPALSALAANYSRSLGALASPPSPTITLVADTMVIILLPRVHIYAGGGVGVIAAAAAAAAAVGGAGLAPAAIGGITAAALLAALLLALAALAWRRRKAAKVLPQLTPPDTLLEEAVAEASKGLPEEAAEGPGSAGENGGAGEGEDVVSPPPILFAPPITPDPPHSSLNSLVTRAQAVRDKRKVPRLGGLNTGGGGASYMAPAALAAAASHAREQQLASEAATEARRERARKFQVAAEEHRKAEKYAELLLLPAHARLMVAEKVSDNRKWWSAPRVKPENSRLDRTKWAPLEKEKAAILAAGGVWPPPDPLLTLLHSGEGRLVNGQVVTVTEFSGGTEAEAKAKAGEALRKREEERRFETIAKARLAEQQAMSARRRSSLPGGGVVGGSPPSSLHPLRAAAPSRPTAVKSGGGGGGSNDPSLHTATSEPAKATLDSLDDFVGVHDGDGVAQEMSLQQSQQQQQQQSLHHEGSANVSTAGSLHTGDYSLSGMEEEVEEQGFSAADRARSSW